MEVHENRDAAFHFENNFFLSSLFPQSSEQTALRHESPTISLELSLQMGILYQTTAHTVHVSKSWLVGRHRSRHVSPDLETALLRAAPSDQPPTGCERPGFAVIAAPFRLRPAFPDLLSSLSLISYRGKKVTPRGRYLGVYPLSSPAQLSPASSVSISTLDWS